MVGVAIRMHLNEISIQQADSVFFLDKLNFEAQVGKVENCFYFRMNFIEKFASTFQVVTYLSPGQTDRQVVPSGRKLSLRRDLRWVAKRTRKFPLKYT